MTDHKGKVLVDSPPPAQPDEAQRAIPARNAYVMSSLLQEVTRSGTAARAQQLLKRHDLFGKTGTTNDAMDAWFAGYQPQLTGVVWIGYDTPRKLGDRETGGGLSLPVWISYMETALRGVPVAEYGVPEGLVNVNGEWLFEEYARGGVSSVGLGDKAEDKPASLPPSDEKRRILDLFRN
jgi:penicillin-binding protein 1A